MKQNRRKIRYIINHKKKGKSCETIARDIKISMRRVEQIWKEYRETGEEPVVGKNLGRPKKPLNPEEVEIIKEAFDRFKLGGQECLNISAKDFPIFIYYLIDTV